MTTASEEASPAAQTRDLYDVISNRRDVRAEFTGAPMPPAALTRILRAGHCAPSVGLSQPWDFVLIEDSLTKSAFHSHVIGERRRFHDSLTTDRSRTFESIKIEGILESTVSLVVTYDDSRGGPAVLGRHASPDAGLYSVCLAIENMWLAATAEGLGMGWVSFFREDYLRGLLGIPDTIRPIAWLCLGPVTLMQQVPDLERHGWRDRIPLSQVVHREFYGNTAPHTPNTESIG
ncbi:5,6-dimethylbenzimidazole synthase [Mycolicibacterium neoaurum]|uniref:5,6-dimethylbenzimidazole synthase n=1 Tax=Mycolicibacterium neoaurum TaxID=1795 RepID=UPI002673A65B|nr:5,6-dimethylbenzimidazole synthase [Mycolicibacterium neoaurum]MDO3401595.1 5,6-dimethylbenzimidazole synthase [Mycolicibacterium neoaurum]